jgi:hypothetical protein
MRQDQAVRHVDGGRKQDEPGDPPPPGLCLGQCQQQRDPAAHRRADDDERRASGKVQHGGGLLQPARDRAVGEIAARFAMAGIVEPRDGASLARREGVERLGLGAAHVGHEAAEEENLRPLALAALERQPPRAGAAADVQLSLERRHWIPIFTFRGDPRGKPCLRLTFASHSLIFNAMFGQAEPRTGR